MTQKSPRNQTIVLSDEELKFYKDKLIIPEPDREFTCVNPDNLINRTINGDTVKLLKYLPDSFVDLLFIDPPYNLTKQFNTVHFNKQSDDAYIKWLTNVIDGLYHILKPTASIYICCDWQSSQCVYQVIKEYFPHIRNRITWEREKGRGAKSNWKNASEDIWFCTMSNQYTFNVNDVKLRRKVIAPYKDADGNNKDWFEETDKTVSKAGKYRDTFPSNLWNDITIPFWSMPENTDHPTQKPEKLVAKCILASSNKGDVVFDPFLGSGTTSVAAKKLNRKYVGIELDEYYACITEKRLADVDIKGNNIQGYDNQVFWERNSKI